MDKGPPEEGWSDIGMGEDATLVRYRPAGWEEQSYVVIRRRREKGQALLLPAYIVILVSRDELVRRHRGEQGQENAFKGRLIDLDLHHPPCRKFRANQAFYIRGPIAQMLLPAVQYRLLPTRGRRWRLDFARNNFRLAGSTTPPSNSNSSRHAEPIPIRPGPAPAGSMQPGRLPNSGCAPSGGRFLAPNPRFGGERRATRARRP